MEEHEVIWLIQVPGSMVRGEPLFYATKDEERAQALVAELAKEHQRPSVKAEKVWLEGSHEAWGNVTRWERMP